MVTNRHSTKPQTNRHKRGHHHASAGVQSQARDNHYIPIFVFIALILFFAVTMAIKIYHQ